jgi:hypothetical protein
MPHWGQPGRTPREIRDSGARGHTYRATLGLIRRKRETSDYGSDPGHEFAPFGLTWLSLLICPIKNGPCGNCSKSQSI